VEDINSKGYAGEAIALAGDVTEKELSKRAVALALEKWGHLDILVNNVGQGETTTIDTTTDEHWQEFIDINLNSAFYFNREVSKHFAKTLEGSIINVSSINGVKPGAGVAYCSSKCAMNIMTRNMAVRFAGTKVRLNTLSPGMTDTDQPFFTGADYKGAESMRPHSMLYLNTEIDGHIPPRSQAYGALFLASEMSEYMTGQNLVIEKGRYFN
jgi:NAD(P)-dependent dehydrogenase (short-subunit alcohol dehydrogenase family)